MKLIELLEAQECAGDIPAHEDPKGFGRKLFKQTPSGTNKPNPAFDKIVNQFFKPLED